MRGFLVALCLFYASIAQAQEDAYTQGLAYHEGRGVVQNYATAATFFRTAAQQGHAPAQNILGRYLFEGLGVDQDHAAALRWFEEAAKGNDPAHVFDLAKVLETDPDQIPRAAALFEDAVRAGHLEAAVHLGVLYQNGTGVAQDFERARNLYEGPAAAGNARALNNLGLLFVRGDGVPQDYARAAEYFAQAVELGLPTAMTNLGVLYENGYGVPLDEARAAELYRLAGRGVAQSDMRFVYDARLVPLLASPEALDAVAPFAQAGDPIAQFQFAWILMQDTGADFDAQRAAAQLFRLGAEDGHGPSMANLGAMYFRGEGLPQDFVLGKMWILLAQAASVSEAGLLAADQQAKLTAQQVNDSQAMAQAKGEP